MSNQEPFDANAYKKQLSVLSFEQAERFKALVRSDHLEFICDSGTTNKIVLDPVYPALNKKRSPAASIWHKDALDGLIDDLVPAAREIVAPIWQKIREKHKEDSEVERVVRPRESGDVHTISALTYRNITTNWYIGIEPWNRMGGLRCGR